MLDALMDAVLELEHRGHQVLLVVVHPHSTNTTLSPLGITTSGIVVLQ